MKKGSKKQQNNKIENYFSIKGFQENYGKFKQEIEDLVDKFKDTYTNSSDDFKNFDISELKIFLKDMFLKNTIISLNKSYADIIDKISRNLFKNLNVDLSILFSRIFQLIELLRPEYNTNDLSFKSRVNEFIDNTINDFFKSFDTDAIDKIIVQYYSSDKSKEEIQKIAVNTFLYHQPLYINYHKAMMNLSIYAMVEKDKIMKISNVQDTQRIKSETNKADELLAIIKVSTIELLQFLFNLYAVYMVLTFNIKDLRLEKFDKILKEFKKEVNNEQTTSDDKKEESVEHNTLKGTTGEMKVIKGSKE